MHTRYRWILVLLLAGVLSARAADAPAQLVAGYKALFTCSAIFLAGRTSEQIAGDELTGIYRDYETTMAALPGAKIDRAHRAVSVAFEGVATPRVARFRRPLGCTLLPPGADAAMPLPSVELPEERDQTDVAWPDGDKLDRQPVSGDPGGGALARLIAQGFDHKTYGEGARTSAVVVVADGRIAGESYSSDSGFDVPQRTWSVAKSITGALVGIAAKDGLLKPEDATGLPQWATPGDRRGKIRIVDLMHMMSGLEAGAQGNRTDEIYFGGGRVVDHALTHELVAPPNTRWFYANNDVLILSYLLRKRIGDDEKYLAYPYERLFRRIGMSRTTAETDWDGTFILSSQVWTTARDLARFGMLLANDGVWNGERVLPVGWVKLMATPAPVQPPAKRGDRSVQAGYGGDIWLFGERHGLPEGTLAAMGNRGQYVVAVPSRKIVIVRRGFDSEDARFAINRFAAEIVAAMGEK